MSVCPKPTAQTVRKVQDRQLGAYQAERAVFVANFSLAVDIRYLSRRIDRGGMNTKIIPVEPSIPGAALLAGPCGMIPRYARAEVTGSRWARCPHRVPAPNVTRAFFVVYPRPVSLTG
jgi:hypothetical protein